LTFLINPFAAKDYYSRFWDPPGVI